MKIEINTNTFAILLSGLYCSYHEINEYAIPYELWYFIAEKVVDWFDDWDYSALSFEDWIKYNILIYPKIAMSDEEIESCMNNDLYMEWENGNVLLVVSIGKINEL